MGKPALDGNRIEAERVEPFRSAYNDWNDIWKNCIPGRRTE